MKLCCGGVFFSFTAKQLLHLMVLIYRNSPIAVINNSECSESTNRLKRGLGTSLNLIQLTPLFLSKTRWRVVVMTVAVSENLDLMHPLP